MRNRWLVNLLLLILVIALGSLMRWELERERRVSRLTGLPPEEIEEISIERTGRADLRLARGADGWRMEAPYQVPAAAGRIRELVGIAATPVHRSLPAGTPLEGLGLRAQGLRLSLNGLVLRFGDVDPVAQHRYVAVGGQVHLIGDGFYHHLIAPAEDYVDRRLLPAGFRPDAGTLGGTPLSDRQLRELETIGARAVEPMDAELTGRLLALASDATGQSLRFLVTSDGRGWARLDLRLRYLLETAPPWAVTRATAAAAAGDPLPAAPGP